MIVELKMTFENLTPTKSPLVEGKDSVGVNLFLTSKSQHIAPFGYLAAGSHQTEPFSIKKIEFTTFGKMFLIIKIKSSGRFR